MTGEEFEIFIDVLSKLNHLASLEGIEQMVNIIADQAELKSDFQVVCMQRFMYLYLLKANVMSKFYYMYFLKPLSIAKSPCMHSFPQPEGAEAVDRFITCFRLALRFFKVHCTCST